MSDQDYIRKAVKLADGWDLVHDEDDDVYWIESPTFTSMLDKIHTEMKDALAAQLVRQVDALGNFWVDSDPHGTAKVWSGSAFGVGDMSRIAKANDENRTMNTIKAIVDSKVLK